MRSPFVRSTAVMLAFCGLLLRGLLPAGWMPDRAASNGIPLTICTMDGLQRIDPDKGHPGKHDPASHPASQVCPFAAVAHLAPPATAPALQPALSWATLAPGAITRDLVISSEPDRANGPRAPPELI